jgi:hypothetical protein
MDPEIIVEVCTLDKKREVESAIVTYLPEKFKEPERQT